MAMLRLPNDRAAFYLALARPGVNFFKRAGEVATKRVNFIPQCYNTYVNKPQ